MSKCQALHLSHVASPTGHSLLLGDQLQPRTPGALREKAPLYARAWGASSGTQSIVPRTQDSPSLSLASVLPRDLALEPQCLALAIEGATS